MQTAIVDDPGGSGTRNGDLTLDGSGRLHVSYTDDNTSDFKYATCATGCLTPANWTTVTVDTAGLTGRFSSMVMDESGRLHVAYHEVRNGDLKYATCAADCTTATNWQLATVEAQGVVGSHTSLAVDADGRLHVTYLDATNLDLKYATCPAGCAAPANWQSVSVDQPGSVGFHTSLGVDLRGRLHVAYHDQSNGDLKYGTCAVACTAAGNWRSTAVDSSGSNVGRETSLLVRAANGRLHISYTDVANGLLKYIE